MAIQIHPPGLHPVKRKNCSVSLLSNWLKKKKTDFKHLVVKIHFQVVNQWKQKSHWEDENNLFFKRGKVASDKPGKEMKGIKRDDCRVREEREREKL